MVWTTDALADQRGRTAMIIPDSDDSRVVTVSSLACTNVAADWDDLDGERSSREPAPTAAPSSPTCCSPPSGRAAWSGPARRWCPWPSTPAGASPC